jgi:ribonuclease BN (tRNA processing enzyme)
MRYAHATLGALAAYLLAACPCPSPSPATAPAKASPAALERLQQRTHVVLLGTGTPNADPARHGPATAVVVRGVPYLVDCGPGVVRRAAAAHRRGIRALKASKLDTAFLTHLHSDHTTGLADLMLTPWTLGRKRPLRLHGPPGTVEMARYLQHAYWEDVSVRQKGLEPANESGHRVDARDHPPGVVFKNAHLTVKAFRAAHGAWRHAYGYRFVTPEMDVCISGDTRPYPQMKQHYASCDVLLHEVYSKAGFARRPKKWQRYHAASHTSTVQLGDIARQVRPGLLVLYHQLFWGSTPRQLLQELAGRYRGRVVSGSDLMVIGVSTDFRRAHAGKPRQGRLEVVRLKKR